MPKISFIMITAREDYPYLGRPDLHLFEPTLESFKHQTLTDCEWVIVDVLYEQRKNYFKNKDLPFAIKHIPAKPNLWLKQGLPGISTQYNKGIIYADGELLFFTGDSHIVTETFMENLWTRYNEGYFPLAWYFFDQTFSKAKSPDEIKNFAGTAKGTPKELFDIAYPEQNVECPISYNLLGYVGKTVTHEHRYLQAFANNNKVVFSAPWEWWFGCSSASMDAMLKINGFNQKFDGDFMLLDCDVGSRLQLAGYGSRLALFRDIFLIRATTEPGVWNPAILKSSITIKCNYPLIWINRYFKRYKANVNVFTETDIDWMKDVFCKKYCWLREQCRTEHPWQFPFEHKSGPSHPPKSKSSKRWFNFWMSHQGLIDLREERDLRLSGNKKYAVGTFYG